MDRLPISRKYVEANWQPSLGEKFWLDHFREPPPGHLHAECPAGSKTCLVHYDDINPHNSLADATKHFVESDLGFAITVVLFVAGLAGLVYWFSNPHKPDNQNFRDS
jgi:hypothetical protein